MEKTVRQKIINTENAKLVSLIIPIIALIVTSFFTIQRMNILANQVELTKEQIEIMKQSLERKPKLLITIIPSHLMGLKTTSNGTTEVTNSTLLLSRNNNFTFTVCISNVGDAFAHIIGYAVSINCPYRYTDSKLIIDTIILEPNGITSFEYTFDPTAIPKDVLSNASNVSLTFTLFSAETSICKVINAQFR